MGNYLVTFELRSDATYNQRYRSLAGEIQARPTLLCWDQSTSFAAISSPETIDELAERLHGRANLGETDLLLVIDPAASRCIACGPVRDEAVLSGRFAVYERR